MSMNHAYLDQAQNNGLEPLMIEQRADFVHDGMGVALSLQRTWSLKRS
jgi:hypothetical protein